ncbi:RagB/SusD family nutrient uptake outer membrane protein [Mucilaginibacter sp. CAU 1740]|uniref:RagB/SusD family nutrient uptake outer membrane protein n=1 Tax=Mucilaginibacter sp. CAU 1740 TaxID=3140365 RepID=UPI00325C064F
MKENAMKKFEKVKYNIAFKKICLYIFYTTTIIYTASCKKFVEINPPSDQLTGANIYNDPGTAAGVLTSIYHQLSVGSFAAGGNSLSVDGGLSADELDLLNKNEDYSLRFYINKLSANTNPPRFWSEFYEFIFRANSAIKGLNASHSLNDKVKVQLLGEAKFIRALCYFYLVNLYGDVPLILTTDPKETGNISRTHKTVVYQQIIVDLLDAQRQLNENYLKADALTQIEDERARPNRATATALLARVYLYLNQSANAEKQSTVIIEDSRYILLDSLNDVFLKNSKEAIWQLQPINSGNTPDGGYFIPTGDAPSVFLSNDLFQSFQSNDKRKFQWIGSITANGNSYSYPFKYQIKISFDAPQEYTMVFRLGEQYLIRAEARAISGNLSGARDDLNKIRHRAGLGDTPAGTQTEILDAILNERRHELFSEWGNRWFDLKRTGKIDQVMSTVTPQKGGTWSPNWALYPIPQTDINRDPALAGHQNPGY